MVDRFVAIVGWFHHIDAHIAWLLQHFPGLGYFFLSVIVFLENGVVLTPFLPGDSLIFICGSFAAKGALDPFALFIALSVSATVGSALNYWIGKICKPYLGNGLFMLVKPEYIARTESFFIRYGALTVGIAKFLPILRTFAPFLAGVGNMAFGRFMLYNVAGSVVWIGFFVVAGYYFGSLPIVANHLGVVIFGILIVSVTPVLVQLFKRKSQ